MPLDTRTPEGVYATKGNIVAPTVDAAGPRAKFDSLPEIVTKRISDAATGASGLVTDDATGQTADTGPLGAGTYRYFLKARHPSTAAANRSVILEHRNAANSATVRTLKTLLADGPLGRAQTDEGTVTLVDAERIRVITGSDATNANILLELRVERLP